MKRFALLLLFSLMAPACSEPEIAKVRPVIKVTATHVDDDGSHLLDFGDVPVLLRKSLVITIENIGRAPLGLEAFEMEADEGIFTADLDPSGTTLKASEKVEINVTFRPAAQEPFAGLARIVSTDTSKKEVTVTMEGRGSTIGRAEIDPRQIDFGMVGEWTQEVRNIRIASVGTAPLLIESVELLEGSSDAFVILGSTKPTELPPPAQGRPGGEVLLGVACAPTEATEGVEIAGKLRLVTTDPEQREVVIDLSAWINRAPFAVIEVDPSNHAPNLPIRLDGTKSWDPDGHMPLEPPRWRVFRKPLDANAEIVPSDSWTPDLIADTPGEYEVGLDVSDSEGVACYPPDGSSILPCERKKVVVQAEDDLIVRLIWDHKLTDLDLHLLDTGQALNSEGDCYWANRNPDFGIIGDPSDDPVFVKESLKGYGPEEIVFSKPTGGKYKVAVHFAKANGSTKPRTVATVQVYIYGKLEAEMTAQLDKPDQIWEVLEVEWPTALVTEIDSIGMVAK